MDSYRKFPVVRNSRVPHVEGWPELATTDAATIANWKAKFPGCNWGIATGQGLVVLDVDNKNGKDGTKSLQGHCQVVGHGAK